jgi:hypothetical protein
MIDDSISQAEKRSVLRNDAREQSNTMHGRAVAETSIETGRFTQVNAAHVTGSTPIPQYPAAGAHQSDPVPTEPPLGFSVNDLESSVAPPAEDTGPTSDGNAPSAVIPSGEEQRPQDVGPSSSVNEGSS